MVCILTLIYVPPPLYVPPSAPEGAPTNVLSANITSDSLTLTWDPPPRQLQNGVIRHYIVVALELNTGINITYMVQSHTMLSVGDLHPFYSYEFSVFAVTVEVGPSSLAHRVSTLEDGKLCFRGFGN